MIKRFVRMEFRKKRTATFLEIFRESCDAIRASEGCMYLELMQDTDDPNVYVTLSVWQSEAALEAYRRSALFAETWKRTRKLFKRRAQAWSLNTYLVL